jgi:hypothetical protein
MENQQACVNLSPEAARQIYKNTTDSNLKKELESKFSKQQLSGSVLEWLESYEQVCEIKGIDPIKSLPFPNPKNKIEGSSNDFFIVSNIADVIKEGWEPNYNDKNEYKYWPWMEYQAGCGFSDSDYGGSRTGAHVGSRLVFPTKEKAEFFATKFRAEFSKYLLGLFQSKITAIEEITSFEIACSITGDNPNLYNEVKGESSEDRSDRFYKRLKIIVKAINKIENNGQDWFPDFNNTNQMKYRVWLTDYKAGVGFSDSYYDYSYTRTGVGSRLLLVSAKAAVHCGSQFLAEWNGYTL